MPNIDAEIQAFQTAVYGEDVRSALISLAQKLNSAVEAGIVSGKNLAQITQQANTAKSQLQPLVDSAGSLKTEINQALTNAQNVVPDVVSLKAWKTSVEAGSTAVVVKVD